MTTMTDIALKNIEGSRVQFAKLRFRLQNLRKQTAEQRERTNLIMAILKFCEEGCELAKVAVEKNSWIHELILVRPMSEASLRLYYAIRVPDGWARYRKYYWEQDIKRLKAFKEVSENPPTSLADTVPTDFESETDNDIKRTEGYLESVKGVTAMEEKLPPLLDTLFKAEEAILVAEGDSPAAKGGLHANRQFTYAFMFRVSHTLTHAHPDFILSNFAAHLGHCDFQGMRGVLFVQAAYIMTRVSYIYAKWENMNEDANAFVNALGEFILPDERKKPPE